MKIIKYADIEEKIESINRIQKDKVKLVKKRGYNQIKIDNKVAFSGNKREVYNFLVGYLNSIKPVNNLTIVNKTPHDIIINTSEGEVVIKASKKPIRLEQKVKRVGFIEYDGFKIPLTRAEFGEANKLPQPNDNTIYLVSSLVAKAYPNRKDFYIINETIRDTKGNIIGCKSLSQNPYGDGK